MDRFENIREHLVTCSSENSYVLYKDARASSFFDEDGKEFLCLNEISLGLGYGHLQFTERVAQLVKEKMIGHLSPLSYEKEKLIKRFMEYTHGDFDKFFMASSGGEVVDWAIKIARRVTGKDRIISFRNALHGRSFAGAFISDTPLRKEGFGSGLDNVTFWDYPADGRKFEKEAQNFDDIAGIILEPYQALGGMASPAVEYYRWLREYADRNNIVIIFDEIQTGFGKTGSMFAYEDSGIVPDILLLGKAMSNGFGLGALLMNKRCGEKIKPYEMSGGSADNDLMCGIVNTVFDIYEEEKILEHVQCMGELLKRRLSPYGRLRGKGLFISLETEMAEKIIKHARENGVILGGSKNRVMLRAPLVISEEEINRVCDLVGEVCS